MVHTIFFRINNELMKITNYNQLFVQHSFFCLDLSIAVLVVSHESYLIPHFRRVVKRIIALSRSVHGGGRVEGYTPKRWRRQCWNYTVEIVWSILVKHRPFHQPLFFMIIWGIETRSKSVKPSICSQKMWKN